MTKKKQLLLTASMSLLLLVSTAAAQTTAFTYQGKLTDSGNLANGNYDFQFKLFDALMAGTQQSSTIIVPNILVTNGVFTVQLDFGVCASCFNGAARFLEISVQPTGGGGFTTLSPRQLITSTPYPIKTTNLTFNGPHNDGTTISAASNTFAGDSAGLNSFSSFLLNNPVGKFNSFFGAGAGQANIQGNYNAFFGFQAGQANTSGTLNSFFGALAGQATTSGCCNAFFGEATGRLNTTGSGNAFFGEQSGEFNTTGSSNVFFGFQAGQANTTSNGNAFFGSQAGLANTTGGTNSFFGSQSGNANTTGNDNAFFGNQTGNKNTIGLKNTFIGSFANFNSSNPTGDNNTLLGASAQITSGVSNATAIGANARVTQNNSLVLGAINGLNGATADTNVGIGTTAPLSRFDVVNLGTQIRFGEVAGDFGGYLISTNPTQAILSGGAKFDGTNWIAKDTSASRVDNLNGATRFFTDAGLTANTSFTPTERMRIASNGDVGIGTTGPVARLHVAGDALVTNNLTVNGTLNANVSSSMINVTTQYNFGGNRVLSAAGSNNIFVGIFAGANNTGGGNAFFGQGAGNSNTTGGNNTFIGKDADFNVGNPTGSNNTLLGASSIVISGSNNATAIGYQAQVSQSNSLVLGSINGVNGATSDTNVGIGTTAPLSRLDIVNPGTQLRFGDDTQDSGGFLISTAASQAILSGGAKLEGITWVAKSTAASLLENNSGTTRFYTNTGLTSGSSFTPTERMRITSTGSVGIGDASPADKLQVVGDVRVGTSGTNGCLKNFGGGTITGTCSSDARFKRDITPFPNLLSRIVHLQPVYFYWRTDQFPDRHFGQAQEAGLIAQEVEKVLPELVSEDEQGYKAVNYSKLPLLSLQAIKELKAENDTLKQKLTEQQTQLTLQQQQMTQQQQEMVAIKKLLCASQPHADICKAKSLN